MKVLVTGAKGFVGMNLVAELKNQKVEEVFEYDINTEPSLLNDYCNRADFVFHLAGVNRPKEQAEFMEGNFGFTSTLLDTLKKYHNTCPVLISSSTQAAIENPYGQSKKAGEDFDVCVWQGNRREGIGLPVAECFGKWCRPNYNSAVATFCHNIANDLPVTVNDRNVVMTLVYIDDVVAEMMSALNGNEHKTGDFCEVPVVHTATLGKIVDLIESFKASRKNLQVANMADEFEKKLYSTYLSYLPADQFSYALKMNVDDRGSFTEIIRTLDRGQFSVNITKPGITKGNHWHNTKNEKFLVVSGEGLIRFRNIFTTDIIDYYVNGEKLELVDIPTGYTHNIKNVGNTDLITFMWANEVFNPDKPDTYFQEV